MPKNNDREPKPGELLFENLFSHREPESIYELVGQGLVASYQNAERLLNDATYLADSDRLSSARFLMTTTREELAKSYILLDCCRLDFTKHQPVLRALCKAFYDHVAKHAYLEVLTCPYLDSMSDVMTVWKAEVKRWWPAPPESGEPNMPHDTYFDREFPLDIDFDDYSKTWVVPDDSLQKAHFMKILGTTPLSEVGNMIDSLRTAQSMGLYGTDCLGNMNAIFKQHYIGDGAAWESAQRLYGKVSDRLEEKPQIPKQSFLESPLARWPLYHCVMKGY
jgi:AbiV family abortive infection protein